MNINKRSNLERPEPTGWLASHKALAAGLWIVAFGILVQAATGAKNYSTDKVPPGIPILVVAGLIVYFTSRWAWTILLGLFLAILISIGVFTTAGTAYRLNHPQDIGPLIGTLVQLAGLVFALIAGIAATVRVFRRNRGRSVPQT